MVSPDGRWLAYESAETGALEVYVSSFPVPGEKYRVTTSGGAFASQWSRDGRELLIWTLEGPLLLVDVQTTPTFKAGTPRVLFSAPRNNVGIAATSDLKRFLAALPAQGGASPSITVVLNWGEALKRQSRE
jgi:hypothetical protein